jgi:hypothetical protein
MALQTVHFHSAGIRAFHGIAGTAEGVDARRGGGSRKDLTPLFVRAAKMGEDTW